MKTRMGTDFWKKELIKQFNVNDIGEDLLEIVEKDNPEKAMNFILHQFKRLDREEILTMFSEEYTNEKINLILEDLDKEKLDEYEIINFEIKVEESEEEEM